MSSPADSQNPERLEWHTIKLIENPVYRYGLLGLVLVYLFWSVGSLEVDWVRAARGIPRAGDMLSRMFPPNFDRWELLSRELLVSVQMAFAASLFGMILAVPLGLCAASNLAPRPVYLVARFIIILSRTFHEIIWAIFFVKIVG
ncbi:MAG: phosphonate ABC transporter, permease protein PhnE, partial [Alphaproteobacteria bacterium]|nr:phosphonate ABC transporter, permease protein PhnE [Alphaproteobacteria bacterium]